MQKKSKHLFAYVSDDSKKYCRINLWAFLIALESSETYFDLVVNKIGAKLNFMWKFSIEKSPELKINIFLNEFFFKSEKCFCIGFRTLDIF